MLRFIYLAVMHAPSLYALPHLMSSQRKTISLPTNHITDCRYRLQSRTSNQVVQAGVPGQSGRSPLEIH